MNRRRRTPRSLAWLPPEEDDGYAGPARLVVDGQDLPVRVHLAGHLEPLDGRYHWYGRVERSDDVVALKEGGTTRATLTVDDGGSRDVRLAEYDAWGHVLVSGLGAPPYPLPQIEVDLPATP